MSRLDDALRLLRRRPRRRRARLWAAAYCGATGVGDDAAAVRPDGGESADGSADD